MPCTPSRGCGFQGSPNLPWAISTQGGCGEGGRERCWAWQKLQQLRADQGLTLPKPSGLGSFNHLVLARHVRALTAVRESWGAGRVGDPQSASSDSGVLKHRL